MSGAPARRCVLVIPDAGPVISLYRAGRLDLLLRLDMPVVLVDEVVFELTRDPSYSQDRAVLGFIRDNSSIVRVAETAVGRMAQRLRESGVDPVGQSLGEEAIASFVARNLAKEKGPVLVLFEDADIARMTVLLRGDVHLLSTKGLLVGMERRGLIPSAQEIIELMTARGRRYRDEEPVDRPAPSAFGGNSRW